MINPDVEDMEAMHPAVRYGILVFFIVVCTVLIVNTVLEFIRNRKAGLYNADAYEDDEGIEPIEEPEPDDDEDEYNDDDDKYDDEYDEYDDEYDEYDDEDDEYDDEDDEYDDEDDEYDNEDE